MNPAKERRGSRDSISLNAEGKFICAGGGEGQPTRRRGSGA